MMRTWLLEENTISQRANRIQMVDDVERDKGGAVKAGNRSGAAEQARARHTDDSNAAREAADPPPFAESKGRRGLTQR